MSRRTLSVSSHLRARSEARDRIRIGALFLKWRTPQLCPPDQPSERPSRQRKGGFAPRRRRSQRDYRLKFSPNAPRLDRAGRPGGATDDASRVFGSPLPKSHALLLARGSIRQAGEIRPRLSPSWRSASSHHAVCAYRNSLGWYAFGLQ